MMLKKETEREKIIETAERVVLIRDNAVALNLMEIDGLAYYILVSCHFVVGFLKHLIGESKNTLKNAHKPHFICIIINQSSVL